MNRTLVSVVVALSAMSAPAEAARLPLPPDVTHSEVEGPTELLLGAQVTQMEMFATKMSPEGLRAFYEKALKEQGWVLHTVPWLTQLDTLHERINEEVAKDPTLLRQEGAAEKLEFAKKQRDALAAHVKDMVYAAQGSDRLLLRFIRDEAATVVSVHRWESAQSDPSQFLAGSGEGLAGEASPELAKALAQAQGEPPADWLSSNACCSGDRVPAGLRQLPNSVPEYPGRMFSSAAMPDISALGAKIEFYGSQDSKDAVKEFYLAQMPQFGWALDTSVEPPPPPAGTGLSQYVKTESLMFRSGAANCLVVVSELPENIAEQAMAGIPEQYRASLPPMATELTQGGERTLIVVTYMEEPDMRNLVGEKDVDALAPYMQPR